MASYIFTAEATLALLNQPKIYLKEGDTLVPIDIGVKVTAEIVVKPATPTPTLGLPPEAIRQFQEICKKKGIELSDVQATEEAYNLINLVRAVNGQKPLVVTLTTNEK